MWYQWRYIGNLIFVSCPWRHGWCHGASFLVVARWGFYLSQMNTDEQKPFCSQGEPTNAGKRRQISQSLSANHQHLTINTQHPTIAERFCAIGWLNVSVRLCDFCSSVWFCEKKNTWGSLGILSLTDFHRWTEPFLRTGRAHKRRQATTDSTEPFCYSSTPNN